MKDFDEALAEILATIPGPLAAEQVALPKALGRVTAQPIVSRRTQPPLAVSAMDGYAVRAADLPGALKVTREIAAGQFDDRALEPGEAVRIFTGAPLPPGADAIAIQENAIDVEGGVRFDESVDVGRYVRAAGLDFSEGDMLMPAGRIISPRNIAVIAGGNHPWVKVHRRPRIAVVATGDEIRAPGEPLGPAQIVSSNNLALAAFIEAQGGEAVDFGTVGDTLDAVESAARQLTGFDIVVTTGGASVGKHDLVAKGFGNQGLDLSFWKIAMRPGKPLLFGHFSGGLFLGLPGNPVSSLILALLVLRPMMRKMMGLPTDLPRQQATLAHHLPVNDQRRDFIRAKRLPDGSIDAQARQDSSMLTTLMGAEVLLDRPAHDAPLKKGATVHVIDLRSLAASF
ncbi:MAG: gephyrin-like molybdotransferase Glp [Alphaproteobacteria bacterium]